jgi:isopentenyl diphosphate isomerase/L-lactate dehydrogenase-like FMN-dependent dehydrogenase
MRTRWTGPLVVKGILSGDDVRRAADRGADAVVVSNHGGRQLEGSPATVQVLPEVVDAVGDRVVVLMDGGVRRGGDVVKALALGAEAVLIGRPYLWALAAAGQAGIERVLGILANEMTRTLTLLGCPDLDTLDPSWLRAPGGRPVP